MITHQTEHHDRLLGVYSFQKRLGNYRLCFRETSPNHCKTLCKKLVFQYLSKYHKKHTIWRPVHSRKTGIVRKLHTKLQNHAEIMFVLQVQYFKKLKKTFKKCLKTHKKMFFVKEQNNIFRDNLSEKLTKSESPVISPLCLHIRHTVHEVRENFDKIALHFSSY